MLQKNKDFKPNSLLLGVGRSWIPLNITRFREIGISHLPIVNQPRRFALQTYSTPPSFTKGFILHSETRTSAPRMGGKSCAATLPTTACVMSASSLVRTRSVSGKVWPCLDQRADSGGWWMQRSGFLRGASVCGNGSGGHAVWVPPSPMFRLAPEFVSRRTAKLWTGNQGRVIRQFWYTCSRPYLAINWALRFRFKRARACFGSRHPLKGNTQLESKWLYLHLCVFKD